MTEMPQTHLIRPALWRLPGTALPRSYCTVEFPSTWIESFGRRDRTPPLAALACATKAVADGVRHAIPIGGRRGDPLFWADADGTPDKDGLAALVEEWVGVAFNDDNRTAVRNAVKAQPLLWSEPRVLDLTAWDAGPNGTTTPLDPVQYALLADHAATVLQARTLPVLDAQLRFRRLHRGRSEPDGELLVSWPPFTETCRRRAGSWSEMWSVQLHVRVVTIAWDARPRIAVEWSRRRFLARPVSWVPDAMYRQRVNAVAWWPDANPLQVSGLRGGDRLVQLPLRWARNEQRRVLDWDDATGRLLERLDLDLARERVDLTRLPDDPLHYAPAVDSPGLLISYRTGMEPTSGIGAGFWQVDHSLLHAAVDAALAGAGFTAEPTLGPPARPRLSARQQPQVAGCIEAWTQDHNTLQAILGAVSEACGPSTDAAPSNDRPAWTFQGEDLTVEAHTVPGEWTQQLPEVGDPGLDDIPVHTPTDQRAQLVQGALSPPRQQTVAIVELAPKAAWRGRPQLDPYTAVKRGFVASGRGVQGLEATEGNLWGQADVKHRAKQATLDAMRQLGVQLRVPETIEPVPGGLRQVAIVPVQRNETSAGRAGVYPIVLMIDRDGGARGLAFGDRELQPLPDLVRRFGSGEVEPLELNNRRQQLRQWDSFVDDVIDQLISGPPTLLLLERNRTWWRQLADKRIQIDVFATLATDEGSSRMITPADAPSLRIARIDTESVRHVGALDDGNVSTTHGVYRAGPRRYLSRGRKPKTRQVAENRSAFGSHNRRATRAGRDFDVGEWRLIPRDPFGAGWNPSTVEILLFFLQPQDDPQEWANYIHAQRHVAVQFSDPLQVPAVIHNARLAEQHLDLVDDPPPRGVRSRR